MATVEMHVQKADRNAAFAQSLKLDHQANVEWAFTALFYSGLHYVEAYFAKIGTSANLHDTHGKRDKQITLDSKLKQVSREYFDLKHFGQKARYECRPMKASEVTTDAVPALEALRKHIQKNL